MLKVAMSARRCCSTTERSAATRMPANTACRLRAMAASSGARLACHTPHTQWVKPCQQHDAGTQAHSERAQRTTGAGASAGWLLLLRR